MKSCHLSVGSPTSFPGSSLFLPRGRKREDPGNEVAVATHLFGSSNSHLFSLLRTSIVFRARFIVSVVCSIVYSANPVKPSDRCVAPPYRTIHSFKSFVSTLWNDFFGTQCRKSIEPWNNRCNLGYIWIASIFPVRR